MLTAVLALVLVYMFSIVGYMFFRDHFLVTVDKLDGKLFLSDVGNLFLYTTGGKLTDRLTVSGYCRLWTPTSLLLTPLLTFPRSSDIILLTAGNER